MKQQKNVKHCVYLPIAAWYFDLTIQFWKLQVAIWKLLTYVPQSNANIFRKIPYYQHKKNKKNQCVTTTTACTTITTKQKLDVNINNNNFTSASHPRCLAYKRASWSTQLPLRLGRHKHQNRLLPLQVDADGTAVTRREGRRALNSWMDCGAYDYDDQWHAGAKTEHRWNVYWSLHRHRREQRAGIQDVPAVTAATAAPRPSAGVYNVRQMLRFWQSNLVGIYLIQYKHLENT